MERVLKICKIQATLSNNCVKILFLLLTFLKMIPLSEHNATLSQVLATYQWNRHQQKLNTF